MKKRFTYRTLLVALLIALAFFSFNILKSSRESLLIILIGANIVFIIWFTFKFYQVTNDKEFRNSEKKYRKLVEQAIVGIFITDREGKFLFGNSKTLELAGYTMEEFLKLEVKDTYITEEAEIAKSRVELIQGGESLHYERIYKRKDGSYFEAEINVSLLDNGDVQGVIIDITERKRAQAELLKSKMQYQAFFENDLAGDYISDPNGKLITCNPSFLKIFGFNNLEEALEWDLYKLYPVPKDRYDLLKKLLEVQKLEYYELEMRKKNGEPVYILGNIVGDFNDKRELVKVRGYVIDQTSRKKAENQLIELSQAVEQNPAAIIITDCNCIIEYVNRQYKESEGKISEDYIGKNICLVESKLFSTYDFNTIKSIVTSDKKWHCEIENSSNKGSKVWEFISISSLKDLKGNISHFLLTKEDITSRKEAETQLIASKEKAEELNRLKTNFLSNMSHELRTPMIGILGFSELLTSLLKDAEEKSMSETIYLSGKRLLRTLDMVIDLSQIEASKLKLDLKELDICQAVNDEVKLFESSALKKKLYLRTQFKKNEVRARLDGRLFLQILDNLINNAIKFTKQGGITIIVDIEESQSIPVAVIKIIDSGIGIQQSDLNIIFDEFRQVSEGTRRSYEGTGIGLTIVKKTVEMMGGIIKVESTPGVGSIFILKFPHFNPLSESNTNGNYRTITFDDSTFNLKHKVLVVDDDEGTIEVIKIVLKQICDIDSTKDGETAIKMASDKKYDIILMDIVLGYGCSGVQATKEIRKIKGYETSPIIAVTAMAMPEVKQELLNEGLTHYISKPFELKEFRNMIIKLLKDKSKIPL